MEGQERQRFEIILEEDPDGEWGVHCPALAHLGVASSGRTIPGALWNFGEVLDLVLEESGALGLEPAEPIMEVIHRLQIELCPPNAPGINDDDDGDPADWGATTWDPPCNARGATPVEAIRALVAKLPSDQRSSKC